LPIREKFIGMSENHLADRDSSKAPERAFPYDRT
jgi:hypothetical protein